MFCHKCGTQIAKGMGFCHKCGAKQMSEITEQPQQIIETKKQRVQPPAVVQPSASALQESSSSDGYVELCINDRLFGITFAVLIDDVMVGQMQNQQQKESSFTCRISTGKHSVKCLSRSIGLDIPSGMDSVTLHITENGLVCDQMSIVNEPARMDPFSLHDTLSGLDTFSFTGLLLMALSLLCFIIVIITKVFQLIIFAFILGILSAIFLILTGKNEKR